MDKVFSARLSEAVLNLMERSTRRLRITKKKFLEEAIRSHAERLEQGDGEDVWAETLGAWNRGEKPEATIERSRRAFQKTFKRNQSGK